MLNVALCSYGMSGRVFHAPLISAEPQLRLHSILQRSQASALADYPDVQIVNTFEHILANPDIHLVVVNTPNALHYPMAKAALLAGKHVVVEKPFTLSIAEGRELIALAQQQSRVLSVFQNKRLESDHLDVAAVLASGQLGRVVELEWHYDRYRHGITHKQWKEEPQPGAGTWFDLGIHMVDSVLCLLGKPSAIYADMRSLRRENSAVDYFTVQLHYPDIRVLLRSNTYVSEKGATVTIHGDKGSFLKFGQDVQEAQMQRGIVPGMAGWAQPGDDNYSITCVQQQGGKSERRQCAGRVGCYERYYANIAAAIAQREPLAFTPELSLLGIEILLAAEESARLGRLIELA